MGGFNVRNAVLRYVLSHPKQRINVAQIEKATGFTKEQIQPVLARVNRPDKYPGYSLGGKLEVLARGGPWIYTPHDDHEDEQPEPAVKEYSGATVIAEMANQTLNGNPTFQYVGIGRAGIIVRDQNDKLFTLKEL